MTTTVRARDVVPTVKAVLRRRPPNEGSARGTRSPLSGGHERSPQGSHQATGAHGGAGLSRWIGPLVVTHAVMALLAQTFDSNYMLVPSWVLGVCWVKSHYCRAGTGAPVVARYDNSLWIRLYMQNPNTQKPGVSPGSNQIGVGPVDSLIRSAGGSL